MKRRTFLKSGVAGIALTLSPVTGALRAFAQDAPVPGGTLHLVAPYGTALVLDPHMTWESQDLVVSKAFHRSIYNWDTANNKPILDLAESVQASDDRKSHTFKLRGNVVFHNGRAMTADDVIWSLNRIADPALNSPGVSNVQPISGAQAVMDGKAKTISGLAKIDNLTFTVNFDNATDPGMLFFDGSTSILPQEEVAKPEFQSRPVGCGPFVFDEHVEGSYVSGKKFDRYYKQGLPYADAVTFTITDDYSAMDVAFRAGEVDATVLSEDAFVLYRQDPELSKGLIEVAELFTRHMGLNNEMPPLNDVRVRQAINYAVDRDLVVSKLLKNKAFKATGWLPSTSTAFDASRAPYAFDPARAKALLAEAGLADGFTLEVMVTDSTSGRGVTEAITPFLKDVGITVNMTIADGAVVADARENGTAMAWMRSAGTGPDPVVALRMFDSRMSRAAGNVFAFKDPAFDAMLDEAAATADDAARIELLKKADAHIQDQAPVWFHNYNKGILAVQPWLKGAAGNVTETAVLEVETLWLTEAAPGRG
ncbi:MAG: ABC transporter substrate-binding protein [Alphaproteobacteria bacterium]